MKFDTGGSWCFPSTRDSVLLEYSVVGDLLDVKGLLCPLPVLKARKALSSLEPGALLTVEATDPASVIDFPHFCTETGHSLVEQSESGGIYTFVIERKAR